MSKIADLRKSYELGELDETRAANEPLLQFTQWLDEAIKAEVPEPNAMTVATVGADGRPSTRIVLIKGFDARGLVWYTNYESRKGRELAAHPFAALQFHWVELERVVRIEGRVALTSITRRVRSIRASAPGPRRRASPSVPARCWWPRPPRPPPCMA
jgi:pyridoxamine 5'-phosphate oxidase